MIKWYIVHNENSSISFGPFKEKSEAEDFLQDQYDMFWRDITKEEFNKKYTIFPQVVE